MLQLLQCSFNSGEERNNQPISSRKYVEPKAFPRNDLESKHIHHLDLNPNGFAPKLFPQGFRIQSEFIFMSTGSFSFIAFALQQLSRRYTLSFKDRYVIYLVKFLKPD